MTVTRQAHCEYGQHAVEGVSQGSLYCYSDEENGIPEMDTCKECLYDHYVKYYPGGKGVKHMLYLYPELEGREQAQKVAKND